MIEHPVFDFAQESAPQTKAQKLATDYLRAIEKEMSASYNWSARMYGLLVAMRGLKFASRLGKTCDEMLPYEAALIAGGKSKVITGPPLTEQKNT